jgi:hypothetical protein
MPMHTFPDVHTKTKKDNLQEGSGEIKINEPIYRHKTCLRLALRPEDILCTTVLKK